CDSSLNQLWGNSYGIMGTPNPYSTSPIINGSSFYTLSSLKDTARKKSAPDYFAYSNHVKRFYLSNGQLNDSVVFHETTTSDDFITDALLLLGNIYICGTSVDSGSEKVFLYKFDEELKFLQKVLFEEKPCKGPQLESDGCRLYLSYSDSSDLGTSLKLFRVDENL